MNAVRTKMTKEEWDQLSVEDKEKIIKDWAEYTHRSMQSKELWKRRVIANFMKGVSPLDYDP